MRWNSVRWCLPLVTVSVGCSRAGGGEAEWVAQYDTIGDTVVVRTLGGGLWGAPAVLEPELRIGAFEGEEDYLLGDVNGLSVDAAGNMYVYDRQVPILRKYGPDGTHLGTIGREGGGPGEYKQSDGGMAVLPDGRVLLRDPGNARINIYSAEGEPLDSWPIRGGFYTSTPLFADTAGNVYHPMVINIEDFGNWKTGLVRFASDGTPGDTLLAPDWGFEVGTLRAESPDGNSRSVNTVPFTPSEEWDFSRHGYFVGGVSTRYAIDLYRPDDKVLRLARELSPVPVGSAEKANEQEVATENMRGVDPNWRWNGPAIPDAKPPFTNVYAGCDGRVWVQLSQPGEEIPADELAEPTERNGRKVPPRRFREPVAFDVFEPDGRYLGVVRAPKGFRTYPRPVFGSDHVWAIVVDELEVQYLTRFRIERGERVAG